jgi:HNH endonuclease
MSHIPVDLARQTVERAGNRCEYCGLSQISQEAAFHIDHIVPCAANGPTILSNLALACVSCSLRKGARQTAVDPLDSAEVSLFNPRRDPWSMHFRWDGFDVVGLTPTGRATVVALSMNRKLILAIREEEKARGRHPPSETTN